MVEYTVVTSPNDVKIEGILVPFVLGGSNPKSFQYWYIENVSLLVPCNTVCLTSFLRAETRNNAVRLAEGYRGNNAGCTREQGRMEDVR